MILIQNDAENAL